MSNKKLSLADAAMQVLSEDSREVQTATVAAKNAQQEPMRALPGGTPEKSVVAPKTPVSDAKPVITTKPTTPGKSFTKQADPASNQPMKTLPKTVDQGSYSDNTSSTDKGRKLKDGVNKEADDDKELYEELEIGDLVEDAEGNVGTVVEITEDTYVVDWSLNEATKDDEDDNDHDADNKKGASKKDNDEDEDNEDDEKAAIKEAFESLNFDFSSDVNAIFSGQDDLSEEFKSKVTTIFEAAVKTRVQEYAGKLDAILEATQDQIAEEALSVVSEQVETFLEHSVQNWIQENEVAIESNLRTELTEDFINGLRNLFIENYIDVPDEKLDVLAELSEEVETLKSKLNEQIEENMNLEKTLKESAREEILRAATDGLVETQRDKIYSLAENVEFKDVEAFESAVKTIKENYFPSNKSRIGKTELDDTTLIVENGKMNTSNLSADEMDLYVRAINKSLAK